MIKVKIIEDEQGQYQNEQGKRFNLIACSWVKGQRANEFKEFVSLQDALKYYNLIDTNAPKKKVIAYRKEENPAGIYQDKNGERYNIISESFEEVPEGWTAFESEAEAAAAWDLTPVDEEE